MKALGARGLTSPLIFNTRRNHNLPSMPWLITVNYLGGGGRCLREPRIRNKLSCFFRNLRTLILKTSGRQTSQCREWTIPSLYINRDLKLHSHEFYYQTRRFRFRPPYMYRRIPILRISVRFDSGFSYFSYAAHVFSNKAKKFWLLNQIFRWSNTSSSDRQKNK
jgi:hypothetical protein